MTEEEIKAKFNEVVHDKKMMAKIESTKFQRHSWRNPKRDNTSVGTMLRVLWQLGLLKFK